MEYVKRLVEKDIDRALARGKSVLLLGARQTGKTTLLERIPHEFSLSMVRPGTRQRYEKTPSILAGEIEALKTESSAKKPLVLLDEIQKVPQILDVVQDLIDRKIAQFVLTGSSARKLKRGSSMNLLPGRVVAIPLFPFVFKEHSPASLERMLLDGSLPGMIAPSLKDAEKDLESYVTTYLEEEIRQEALVRNVGAFARFLEYAASESGQVVNYAKLSQEIGLSLTTIQSHYQILEDCLVAQRVEPLIESKTRRRLTRSQKYLLFDLGVRRLAAQEGRRIPKEALGRLFEQWVGLELLRCAEYAAEKTRIRFWRDPAGPEVDWVIDRENEKIPVEVKWTENPTLADAKHLKIFLSEYGDAKTGYVVCRTPRRVKLDKNILAIPWREVDDLVL